MRVPQSLYAEKQFHRSSFTEDKRIQQKQTMRSIKEQPLESLEINGTLQKGKSHFIEVKQQYSVLIASSLSCHRTL